MSSTPIDQSTFEDSDEDNQERGLNVDILPRRRSWIKRLLPGTLMGRALMIVVTPMVLVQLVSTWVFYDRHWESMSRRLADGLAGDIHTILLLHDRYPKDRETNLMMARTVMWLDIEFHQGRILDNVTDPTHAGSKLKALLASAIENRLKNPFLIEVGYFTNNAVIQIQSPEGVFHIVAPRSRLFSSTTYIFLMWMLGSSMVLFAVAIIFMRNQIRPVHRLAEATDRFGRGLDVPNFKPEGGLEVRRAAVAFNLMRRRINRQIHQRTEMLAGVSHDLRTPLTRMKLNLAMLPPDNEVAEIQKDIAEMEIMIEGYLAFARGEGTETAKACNFSQILAEAVDAAKRTGIVISFTPLPPLPLTLRPQSIRRALDNILNNAQRYGDHIWISTEQKHHKLSLFIDDDGPGIPEDKRNSVFRAFFRLDSSRNSRTGGVGLGLSIARDAIRSHGGEITLETSPYGGLRVKISLPL